MVPSHRVSGTGDALSMRNASNADGAQSPRSAQMRGSTRRDTKPEKAIRSALHASGLRFRIDARVWPESGSPRPDVVFRKEKVAIFIDGCFWHACPDHCRVPLTNRDYWLPKLAGNMERDRRNRAVLEEAGWLVIRVWEHEATDVAAARIADTVWARRDASAPRTRPARKSRPSGHL